MTSAASDDHLRRRILERYRSTVKRLVEAHANNQEDPLVLAVRFHSQDPEDIYLFEVLEKFPGYPDDPIFTTEFGPSAELVVLGHLHLWLASPAQLRHAQLHQPNLLHEVLQDAEVIYETRDAGPRAELARQMREVLGV